MNYLGNTLLMTLDVLVNLAEILLHPEPDKPGQPKPITLDMLALALNHPAGEQATKDRAKDLLARLEIIYPPATIELALERVGAQALEVVVARVLEAISIEVEAAE